MGQGLLGVPAVAEQRDHPAPFGVAPDDLGPWDERDLLRRQVVVGGLVGVGVVDAGREDVEQHEAAVSGRCREVGDLEDLRPTEATHLDRSHRQTLTRRLHRFSAVRLHPVWRGRGWAYR